VKNVNIINNSETQKKVLVFGDPHGDFDSLNRIMRNEQSDLNLCVGDLVDKNFEYQTLDFPLKTIPGNHEDWDTVFHCKEGKTRIGNLEFIFPGKTYETKGISFSGMGGNFSPKYFLYKRSELPYPKSKGKRNGKADKRRHFVREEVEECKKKSKGVDIFLTHEAPSFFKKSLKYDDYGCGDIIDDLIRVVEPQIHVFGHHHRFALGSVDNVVSIGLPYPKVAYLKVDLPKRVWFLVNTENGDLVEKGSL